MELCASIKLIKRLTILLNVAKAKLKATKTKKAVIIEIKTVCLQRLQGILRPYKSQPLP